MSDEKISREQILGKITDLIELQEAISEHVGKKLCDHCESPEENWDEQRKSIMKMMKNLLGKYDVAKLLPKEDIGIGVLAVLSYLIQIQHAFVQVVVMIDMMQGESFGEIFLDSMNALSTKAHKELTILKTLTQQRIREKELSMDSFNAILRLEREIDEDNIVICRQISAISVEGETNYTCYIMRKIVSQIEHISDFIKDAAEIIVDI
ncbi:MAG: hypothetical protein P1Q69_12355 [Candidatus Thorarchaeota archaeon]|nr:hypothetical protein [Candidatus Thorarchaeota archaeon]